MLNERNWATSEPLIAPDIIFHNGSATVQGREAYVQIILLYFSAFPDAYTSIEDMIAEGDKVVVRHTFHGTHQGDFMGIAPTGKQASVTGISIFRLVNGKCVEETFNGDDLGILQQLGAFPTPGSVSSEQHIGKEKH